jgi:hypothetical protein
MHMIYLFDEIHGEKVLSNHWRSGTKMNPLTKAYGEVRSERALRMACRHTYCCGPVPAR